MMAEAAYDRKVGTKYDPEIGRFPWFWCLMFGPFYLAYKGLWGHAILWLIMCWTLIFPWVVYPLIARNIVYHKYVKDGLIIKRCL